MKLEEKAHDGLRDLELAEIEIVGGGFGLVPPPDMNGDGGPEPITLP